MTANHCYDSAVENRRMQCIKDRIHVTIGRAHQIQFPHTRNRTTYILRTCTVSYCGSASCQAWGKNSTTYATSDKTSAAYPGVSSYFLSSPLQLQSNLPELHQSSVPKKIAKVPRLGRVRSSR